MQKPCPHCGMLVAETLSRCPNCGFGLSLPPPVTPPTYLTGQNWPDVLLGLAISLFVPCTFYRMCAGFHAPISLWYGVLCAWWLGVLIAYFVFRRRYRVFAIGLLIGVLFWLAAGLLLGLMVLGLLLACAGMKF